MRTLHKKLHLQHHHHTGKVLHHRHTSYRSIAVILLLAGVFMGGLAIMQRVTAESLAIYVTVHVPRPRTPAIISLPADRTTTPGGDTLIAGSCPILSPQAVVVIYIDTAAVGSAVCDANNNFGLSTSLAAGPHTITATATSIDNDAGPASDPVHVTTQPVVTKTPAPALPAAKLTLDSPFTTIGTSRDVTWTGTITDSGSSYKLQLDWGDGTYDSYSVKPGPQQLRHHYTNLAAYNVTFGLSDTSGNYQHTQLAAALSSSAFPAAAASGTTSASTTKTATIVGLYGFFITAICVLAIVRLHAAAFAYTPITLEHHHAKN
jgi:hypothetical protein